MSDGIGSTGSGADPQFDQVRTWLADSKRLQQAGLAIRRAIDWVIDGARTRRYSIAQLQASEKRYIGNRIEHELLDQWDLCKEGPLDCLIHGVPVDVKFSLKADWMIPREAVDHLCLLVTARDERSIYSFGLLRTTSQRLRNAPNQDKKRGISAAGKAEIHWLVQKERLPGNFLLHLDTALRDRIMSHKSGQGRITELFRLVQDKPLPTTAIDTLAGQRDPSKRIRDARKVLSAEGIEVCGWHGDKAKLRKLGRDPLPKDHWMSIKVGDTR